jgi:hypothetical protein
MRRPEIVVGCCSAECRLLPIITEFYFIKCLILVDWLMILDLSILISIKFWYAFREYVPSHLNLCYLAQNLLSVNKPIFLVSPSVWIDFYFKQVSVSRRASISYGLFEMPFLPKVFIFAWEQSLYFNLFLTKRRACRLHIYWSSF